MMSGLVNYGSSDESESSDGEDVSSVPAKPKEIEVKPQDRPSPAMPKKSSLFANLPKPKVVSTPTVEVVKNTPSPVTGSDVKDEGGSQKKSLFFSLPPPKKAVKATQGSAELTSDAQNKPTPKTAGQSTTTSSVSKGLLNLPPPKKKQPVKISLPALPDPDSDDDEPETKRPKSTKGAGLFSVLPKPKTASRKEANRLLIPYTLTKKPAAAPAKPPVKPSTKTPGQPAKPAKPAKPTPPSSSTTITSKSTSGNPLVMGYNSDEDDEDDGGGVNFFSMGDSDHVKERTMGQSAIDAQSKLLATNLRKMSDQGGERVDGSVTESDDGTSRTGDGGGGGGEGLGVEAAPGVTEPAVPSTQDQPLVFNPSMSNNSGYSVPNYSHHAMYNPPYNAQSSQGSNYAQPNDGSMQYGSCDQTGLDTQDASNSMQYYNQPYEEDSDAGYDQSGTSAQGTSQPYLQDEQFAKMVGKNNRGREAIQIIDIKADDQIGSTAGLQNMVKSLTEEKEYRVKLKKEQLPTGQQKRKHQITYLARQAKERELELKNQWAENRQNRKSTNAKYGFF